MLTVAQPSSSPLLHSRPLLMASGCVFKATLSARPPCRASGSTGPSHYTVPTDARQLPLDGFSDLRLPVARIQRVPRSRLPVLDHRQRMRLPVPELHRLGRAVSDRWRGRAGRAYSEPRSDCADSSRLWRSACRTKGSGYSTCSSSASSSASCSTRRFASGRN